MAKKAMKKATYSGGKKSTVEEPEVEEIDEDEYVEPEVEAPEEVPEAVPVPPPSEDDEGQEGEPVSKAGSSSVIIEGEGTTPIISKDGSSRRVARGVPVEVSAEEMAYLKEANLPFKKGKK